MIVHWLKVCPPEPALRGLGSVALARVKVLETQWVATLDGIEAIADAQAWAARGDVIGINEIGVVAAGTYTPPAPGTDGAAVGWKLR